MTSTYTVSRDAETTGSGRRLTDEDRAMAHEMIYHGTDLDEAKSKMANYMRDEVAYLRREAANFKIALGNQSDAHVRTDNRADAIELAVVEVAQLDPAHNERATVKAAGLVFSIFRRDAA